MNIFAVIPLYNEEKHISGLLKELQKYKLPVIVVDDGSKDRSALITRNSKLENLTLLEHRINLGKGAAMKTGCEYAFSKGADAVVFLDSDGQHKPEDLTKFIEVIKTQKYDVIFGSRNYGYGVPLVRYLGNKFASVLVSLLFGIYVSDVLCGFKSLTRKAYKKINWESSGYGVESEIVAKTGKNKLSFCEINVQTVYHDKTKGVTILDAFGILGDVLKWRLTR